MTLPDLFSLQDQLIRDNLMICFSGPFRHSLIEELGIAIRRHLESENLRTGALMDVFSVYVEQAQNIYNYTAEKGAADPGLSSGILVIGRQADRYLVTSGNFVRQEDVPPLLERLRRLDGLDKAALRALYKEQMRKPRDEGSGGAGAGLIDMARKACEPLRYELRAVDDRRSFFSLAALV